MKPSLDSDEEEELGALQKTLRGDVFKQRKDDAAFQHSVYVHETVFWLYIENDITENQSITQFIIVSINRVKPQKTAQLVNI